MVSEEMITEARQRDRQRDTSPVRKSVCMSQRAEFASSVHESKVDQTSALLTCISMVVDEEAKGTTLDLPYAPCHD